MPDLLYLPSLVLGAMDDWIRFVIPAVVFIFWIISQVAGAGKPKQGPPQRRVPPVDPPRAGRGGLIAEVEALLRQVQDPDGGREDEGPVPVEVVKAKPVAPQPLSPSLSNWAADSLLDNARSLRPQRDATVVSEARSEDIADRHLVHLGRPQLGALTDTSAAIHESGASAQRSREDPAETSAAGDLDVPTTARQVRAMLSSPESVRQAIVLSEVLSRPVDRWGHD